MADKEADVDKKMATRKMFRALQNVSACSALQNVSACSALQNGSACCALQNVGACCALQNVGACSALQNVSACSAGGGGLAMPTGRAWGCMRGRHSTWTRLRWHSLQGTDSLIAGDREE